MTKGEKIKLLLESLLQHEGGALFCALQEQILEQYPEALWERTPARSI